MGTYRIGVVLCCALPAAIAYRGIHPSSEGALAFLVFEAVAVTSLCIAVVMPRRRSTRAAFACLRQARRACSKAIVFAMLSYCGFDVISTVAEEAKMARRLIPQATFLALGAFGAGHHRRASGP